MYSALFDDQVTELLLEFPPVLLIIVVVEAEKDLVLRHGRASSPADF